MRIRWKLLILMLGISLVPVIGAGVLARISGQEMGRELSADFRLALETQAMSQLHSIAERAVTVLERDRIIVETAPDLQVRSLERAIARSSVPPVSGTDVYFDDDFDDPRRAPPELDTTTHHAELAPAPGAAPMRGVSFDHPVIRLAPGVDATAVAADIARLGQLTDVYRFVHARHGHLLLWQYASLASGVHSAYPGHGGYPPEFDGRTRPWYTHAMRRGRSTWVPPVVDASTGRVILTRAAPVRDSQRAVVGVTAIDVPMTRILERITLPPEWAASAQVTVAALVSSPDGDVPDLRVVAQQSYDDGAGRWDRPVELAALASDDDVAFAALRRDIEEGVTSVHRMRHDGVDALWVCASTSRSEGEVEGTLATGLLIIVPVQDILASVFAAEATMQTRLDQQVQFTGALLVTVVIVVVLVTLGASRKLTRPVINLADAARRIAGGDLEARAAVTSSDEIGDLASAFNSMVPQLHDRLMLKESLELAKEVQQHLLPAAPPVVPGLDVAGRSNYCDETGGDYFDYLYTPEISPHRLGVAIGDVTGHGIAAALLMTTARAMLRSRVIEADNLATVIGDMNRHLERDTPLGKFMTFFFLLIDAESRVAHWVSAGHDPAIVYSPDTDTFSELIGLDVPLGVDGEWTFKASSREGFTPGQIIVLGTDGIWEARNDAGEMYGKEPLKASIRRAAALSADAIADAIIEDLEASRGSCPQADDVTLQVVKITT